MTTRHPRTPDERAATHRKRRATIAAKRAAYQRQREAQGEAAPQLGLGLAPTDFEASKAKLRQIEGAEKEAEAERVSRQDAAKPGRPTGGNREAARRTGLSEREVRRTKAHVETAEQYPVFQGKPASPAVAAARNLVGLTRFAFRDLAAEVRS